MLARPPDHAIPGQRNAAATPSWPKASHPRPGLANARRANIGLLWCCCGAVMADGAWFRFGADQVSGYFDPFASAGAGYTIDLAARKRVIYQGRDWVSASGYRSGVGLLHDTGDEKRFGP
jgi:hypothetical protein